MFLLEWRPESLCKNTQVKEETLAACQRNFIPITRTLTELLSVLKTIKLSQCILSDRSYSNFKHVSLGRIASFRLFTQTYRQGLVFLELDNILAKVF